MLVLLVVSALILSSCDVMSGLLNTKETESDNSLVGDLGNNDADLENNDTMNVRLLRLFIIRVSGASGKRRSRSVKKTLALRKQK